jgi:GPH family glycoside/pentoside/hexuronide:cation symporter
MTDTPEYKPYNSSNKTVHFWAVGAIADYYMYAMFALISFFFVNSFGMDPRVVGWALFLPRIFDGIADPIIGHWSDNTHTRWGRRRPFLLVSAVIGSGLIMGVWWMSKAWPAWEQFCFVLIMSLLLFLCWGTYTMNHTALGYELSDDYHQRTKVIATRNFYFACAAMTGSYFYWFVGLKEIPRDIFGLHFSTIYHWIAGLQIFPQESFDEFYRWVAGIKLFPNRIEGMHIESVGIAVAALLAALFTITLSKERFAKANRQHVNIIEAIKATMTVRPYMILLGVRIIQTLGGSLAGALAGYIGTYSVCQGDLQFYNSLPIYNGWIGLAVAGLLVALAAKLSQTVGKRRGLIIGTGLAFVAACVLPFFARPGYPYLLLTHMILFGPVLGTLFGVFGGAVMPDICDIDELQSGERREGLFSAVGSFVSKMENSVCTLLGSYVLVFSGFNAQHAAADPPIPQTADVLERMRWLGFTPGIVFSGLAFLVIWFYPVTEKMMADVRAQLDARRRSGQLSEGPESEVMAK